MMIYILYMTFMGFICQGLLGRYLGRAGSLFLGGFCLFSSWVFSIILFFEVVYNGSGYRLELLNWINLGSVVITWGFINNGIIAIMFVVVLSIALLVYIYSIEYMREDPHSIRFMAYLLLFTFFMLVLLSAMTFLQMFLGWEGVGLSSYLLVNYWYTRTEANRSALKAIIVNRVGDYGLALGILLIYYSYRSLDFDIVFSVTDQLIDYVTICGIKINSVSIIGIFLVLGAVGKSAQLGLHVWLPDAMEGPTPVSALIHAATMVTAGVYLLIRCSPIIDQSAGIKTVIMVMGSLTAVFAGTTGCYQTDIKRVIAFSTCSQLGFMIAACGFSAYSVALFHLVNHAFFKALLFLGAGSIIHSLQDEQDMRKMGGLIRLLPVSYMSMLIGSLALVGFPFLSGFYSKELIFMYGNMGYTIIHEYCYYCLLLAGFCTGLYSVRLLKLTFFGETRVSRCVLECVRESGFCVQLVLVILCICSVVVGFMCKDLLGGLGGLILGIDMNPVGVWLFEGEMLDGATKLFPLFVSLCGCVLGVYLYGVGSNSRYRSNVNKFWGMSTYLTKKWGFDIVYNEYINHQIMKWSYTVGFKALDRGLLAVYGFGGIVRFVNYASPVLKRMRSGYIYNYVFEIFFFMTIILVYSKFIIIKGFIIIIIFIFCTLVEDVSDWVIFEDLKEEEKLRC